MMNRLRVPRAASTAAPISTSPADSQLGAACYATTKTASKQPLAFFTPVHYEANYAYPLILWLHGPGDTEGQLKRIMPLVSLRNYVAAAICGTTTQSGASGKAGYAWAQSQPHVALAEQRAFEAIEVAQEKYHVSSRRVFLAGFDCGGTMALRLAMSHPRRFAGAISLGGEFPVGGTPLAGLSEARQVPIFLACGRESQRYPSTIVCDNLKLLHSAGMNLTLREYPGGHEISQRMLTDMDRWIMEIVTGTPSGPGASGASNS